VAFAAFDAFVVIDNKGLFNNSSYRLYGACSGTKRAAYALFFVNIYRNNLFLILIRINNAYYAILRALSAAAAFLGVNDLKEFFVFFNKRNRVKKTSYLAVTASDTLIFINYVRHYSPHIDNNIITY
jgi:hypothetical protein